MSDPVSGEALLTVFEAVTTAHQGTLEGMRVPTDRIAAAYTRRLAATLARIQDAETRQRVVSQLLTALPLAIEAIAAAQPRIAA
jgi:hypothetical protein